jgi:hypothetical protein
VRYLLSPHEQGTPEWYADRVGKVTGSKADCVKAEGKTKGTEATTRRNYRIQIVTERLTGVSQEEDGYQSRDMLAGKEQEPFGRMKMEAETGLIVEEAGFAYMPDLPIGCSVDGFVDGRRGIVEGKCPKSATHIAYLQANRLPPEYVWQVTHNAYVTDAEFAYFFSYDPRLPENLQLLVVRIERAELPIKEYEAKLMQFLSECDALEQQLRKRAA